MAQFLCFYGDGPFSDNVARLAAYPSGYSYFRPFRYRDKWVEASLLDQMRSEKDREEILELPTILAMRFFTPPHERTIVPLRRVSLSHIHASPDQHLVYFVLRDFVDFRNFNLDHDRLEIPDEEREAISESLFFRTGLNLEGVPFANPRDEEEIWARYSQQVAHARLPIKEESRFSVFLRFQTPTRDGEPAPVKELYRSTQTGPVQGAQLTEGAAYEFSYVHRTPGLIESNVGFKRFRIRHVSGTGNLELERPDDEAAAHYQPHTTQLVALHPSGRGEEVILRPDKEMVPTDDNRQLAAYDVSIPLKVQWSLWHQFKTRWLSLILLVAAFMLVNAWNAAQETGTEIWDEISMAVPSGGLGALVWLLQHRVSRGQ